MADLVITIGAKSDQFKKELDSIKKQTKNLEDQLTSLATISGVAFAGLVAGAGAALVAFRAQEKATNDLTQALQNQGLAGKGLVKDYRAIANAIQNKTGVDDDQIVTGQAILQNFIGQKEISKELSQAMVDLAERTGSVESAAEILGRSINGNTRGLKQFGIVVEENLSTQERFDSILGQVNQKFGGLAEASNKGLGGIRGLKNAFGDLLENIGERLAPTVSKAITVLTNFINKINDNQGLITFAVEVGKIAGILLGTITALAGAGLAFLKYREVVKSLLPLMKLLGISVRGLVGATGIGLLLLVVTELALNWETIWPRMVAVFRGFADNITPLLKGLGNLLVGVFSFDLGKIKEGFSEVKDAISKSVKDTSKNLEAVKIKTELAEGPQDSSRAKAAAEAARQQQESEARRLEVLKKTNQLVVAESTGASTQLLELKKKELDLLKQLEDEKYASIRAITLRNLEQNRALQEEQVAIDAERDQILNEEILANNEEFQAMSVEQQQAFREQNSAALKSQLDVAEMARKNALDASLKEQIDANNRYLMEQQRFGTAYAAINSVIYSKQVQGAGQAFGELSALQSSSSKELKAIGKAAAVADITIKTAQSAMNIYAGFSTIPIVGPALGVVGAAAAVAFGAENIGKVLAAREGGLVSGGIPGRDSVPAMLTPGELVVPEQNFSEVIQAVAGRQNNLASSEALAGSPGSISGGSVANSQQLIIGFDGPESEKVLTARRVEARALGTLIEV